MHSLVVQIERTGPWAPLLFVTLFIAASFLMIWRLESMNASGLEGTVLGTLIMPYCSGIGNLIFAFVIGRAGGSGAEVMTNALVNNVTNLTLLIGLPALFWNMSLAPKASGKKKKSKKRGDNVEHRINRLSLLMTLTAVFVFTGAVWALARDGKLDFNDGLVLAGLFFFWQMFHVFDVLKSNARQNRSFTWMLPLDLAALAVGAYATYVSIDWLVNWISHIKTGFISAKNLGLLSGLLMVLPNGLLALYYGWRGNPEIVYTSQVGDGHICIPLCVGIFALYQSFAMPAMFETGMITLFAATIAHVICIAIFGGLPRILGAAFVVAYGVFLWKGF
ncbi:MAG TPA: sodium:calcium symporter [Verrucomicrobiae bacterium]